MGGGLFQRFQKRIERAGRQHVHFVDDIDFVTGRGRAVVHRVDDFADIGNAGVAGRIHLNDIDMAAFGDGCTMLTRPARIGCRAGCTVGADAVHSFGNNASGGGFAGPTDARHHESLGNPVRLKSVFQGPHHCILPDQIGKGFGPVLARQNLVVGRWAIGHARLSGVGIRIRNPR